MKLPIFWNRPLPILTNEINLLYSNSYHNYYYLVQSIAMSRKSKQKETILRVVKGTTSHPTAAWVYDQVRREIPNISLGTVYRDLKLLAQEEQISDIALDGTLNRFDGNTQYHHHFICRQCSRVFDVIIKEPTERTMVHRVAQGTGFKVTQGRYEFYGLCQDCQS